MDEIHRLVEEAAFKDVVVTPKTRLYITFLCKKSDGSLRIPYESAERDFTILRVTHTEIWSGLTLSDELGTLESMKILEKEFGKNITTRNWNTVLKISSLSE